MPNPGGRRRWACVWKFLLIPLPVYQFWCTNIDPCRSKLVFGIGIWIHRIRYRYQCKIVKNCTYLFTPYKTNICSQLPVLHFRFQPREESTSFLYFMVDVLVTTMKEFCYLCSCLISVKVWSLFWSCLCSGLVSVLIWSLFWSDICSALISVQVYHCSYPCRFTT